TPEEQRAFLADDSPDALAKVVDDLLARPQYGERWGRHWLDVARYAETNGYERDGAKPSAWRFRDYVIDSFNRDKPYDRFVTEQLAGDEIDGSNAETQVATTFLRLGTWDDEPADPKVDRYDQLDDVLGTTATAFLGLTLRCARCHDHKFEPFAQADYYKMLAVFEPLQRPQDSRKDLDVAVGTPAERTALTAFGTAGEPPTHPELLDWLAARFVADGWRLKPLHRMIVLSSAYQTSVAASDEALRTDPKDVLLGRWRQRRLEAEAARDSILAV